MSRKTNSRTMPRTAAGRPLPRPGNNLKRRRLPAFAARGRLMFLANGRAPRWNRRLRLPPSRPRWARGGPPETARRPRGPHPVCPGFPLARSDQNLGRGSDSVETSRQPRNGWRQRRRLTASSSPPLPANQTDDQRRARTGRSHPLAYPDGTSGPAFDRIQTTWRDGLKDRLPLARIS